MADAFASELSGRIPCDVSQWHRRHVDRVDTLYSVQPQAAGGALHHRHRLHVLLSGQYSANAVRPSTAG